MTFNLDPLIEELKKDREKIKTRTAELRAETAKIEARTAELRAETDKIKAKNPHLKEKLDQLSRRNETYFQEIMAKEGEWKGSVEKRLLALEELTKGLL